MMPLSDSVTPNCLFHVRAKCEIRIMGNECSLLDLVNFARYHSINSLIGTCWEFISHLRKELPMQLSVLCLFLAHLRLNVLCELLRLGITDPRCVCLVHKHLCIGLPRFGKHGIAATSNYVLEG